LETGTDGGTDGRNNIETVSILIQKFSPLSPLFPSIKLQIFALGYVTVSKHDMLCELCM